MFGLGAFVLASVAQELVARRRRAALADRRRGSRSRSAAVVRRNRRRYGGYVVHAGLAVLLIGVAALLDVPALPRRRALARAVGVASAATG